MTATRIALAALLLVTGTHAALAQDTLSRADVRAETQAAQAAGQIPHGDLDIVHGMTDTHPAADGASVATRAEVRAELAHAVAVGDVTVGDTGRTLAEINPSRYPQPAAAAGLTRAQVRAELAQAERDGDIQVGDESRTLAEIYPQRYAAVRAQDAAAQQRMASN